MESEPSERQGADGVVVHVVGHLTDEVFDVLRPATHAIARSGRAQSVIVIDELESRHFLAGLHDAAELVLTPNARGTMRRWQLHLQSCRRAFSGQRVHAVHLHGLLPCIVGAFAVRASGLQVPIVYSALGGRSPRLMRAVGALAMLLGRPWRGVLNRGNPDSRPVTEHTADHWEATELSESPVARAFFKTARKEARHPLIVTDGRGRSARGVELFAQLAVLLSGEDLRISFNWIGGVDAVSRLRLTAANVGVFHVTGPVQCAARLASGWIYVAPGATKSFPLDLAQAMALGLPCVAFDCAPHRQLIRDTENGYLCRSEREMIDRIAMLIDDAALRERVGQAARGDTRPRFSESEFGVKLLMAYALSSRALGGQEQGRAQNSRPPDTRGHEA